MENKQSPSKKKLLSIQEEKLIRQVDYLADSPNRQSKKPLPIGLEILQKNFGQGSQKVLVSIKPRAPAIKTLYLAEKNRFHSKKGSSKSGSRLAFGDHSSFTTHLSEEESELVNSIACGADIPDSKEETSNVSSVLIQIESSVLSSTGSQAESPHSVNVYNDRPRSPQKCYMYTQPIMNIPKLEVKVNASTAGPNKVDIATLIVTNTSSEDSSLPISSTINKLNKRIDQLEQKILRQEMVFRALDPYVAATSSEDVNKLKENEMRACSGTTRAGCSYIQQYSHVPETSAFQRYAHQAAPLSPSKATTIEKEHNSEQYGRDFTTYDGITARGRRQCASVPCKRDDIPKLAAERVHKIRHKLNPVRDYRLMDTVHYLAQGEFAPRDDGIKLTPSREAVLSDIIYEDVCRTHWPNTRLGRRAHAERCSTRGELQRLIDSMLRERVAHVERRRRRHYRIVKLNHRHESCRPLGKTGDIIVASHKNRPGSEDAAGSDVSPDSVVISERKKDESSRRSHASREKLTPESRHRRRSRAEDSSSPGPSYAKRSPSSREPTCCYHHTSTKPDSSVCEPLANYSKKIKSKQNELTSGSSTSAYKSKSPRLVVKKDCNRRKHTREEPNLEHYILLPTLVVRTPSNVKRQKKFNELYHKILNVQINNGINGSESTEHKPVQNTTKKDIGLNINITLSNSEEQIAKEKYRERNK